MIEAIAGSAAFNGLETHSIKHEEDHATGQLKLLPRYFFLITNWPESQRLGQDLLAHYRRRGTFEDRLSEFR